MFVTLVTVMTTSVVTIFYVCLLPHVYDISLGWTVFHVIFGHWLLANIVFHYVMAAFTQPGTPPPQVLAYGTTFEFPKKNQTLA